MVIPQGALLVGSINIADAAGAFRVASDVLGGRLRRIPDGEPGERFHWIAFQPGRLAATAGLERVGEVPTTAVANLDQRPLRIMPGIDPDRLELPSLGYADAALDSWRIFFSLRNEGQIAPGTRFQVSLPTPAAVVGSYIAPEDRARFEPVYEAAIMRELAQILRGIPNDSLAIQWDTAVELAFIEGAGYRAKYVPWFEDVWAGVIERALRQAAAVPEEVELGYHLCYGDAAEMHFAEPVDTANLVRLANAIIKESPRPVTWIHMPVPIGRNDEAYFEPLTGLAVPGSTEIYLGLIHREDGADGAMRRITSASQYLPTFGVATECGCGRAPAEALVGLLETHRAVCASW
jgi:hypothetical protein